MNLAVVLLTILALLIGTSTQGESVFVYKVPGVTEDGTAATAHEVVVKLKGIKSAVVNIPESTISVTIDETALAPEEVGTALERAGFYVECVKKTRLGKAGSKVPGPVP